tara:strand:- start:59 stop:502 length:444 start_codon:yes stop_codon:yes gene_type:complete
MFNIPVKKLRGVETGTFVVLNQDALPESDDRTIIQDNLELGYVVSGDYMRNGKFVKVIPVIYGVEEDKYQYDCEEMQKLQQGFVFSKDQLKPYHYGLIELSDDAIDYDSENDGVRVSSWRIKRSIEYCNLHYGLAIEICKTLKNPGE